MASEIKYTEWDLNNEQVIVVAGSTAQDIALKYNVYICQNERSFRPSKYLTFYKDGVIEYLYEIIDKPYDGGTPENTTEYKQMVLDKIVDHTNACRVFKLKQVGKVGPIANDSISKSEKPVPFTYGQPRYTTLAKLNKAKVTSDLVKDVEEVDTREFAEWDLDNNNVMVLAGSFAQDVALKYNAYICQNQRSFRPSKYLTFSKDGLIEYLFEIIDIPYDQGTPDNTPEYKQMVDDKVLDHTHACRVFKLKQVGKVGPIVNDSVSKAGKPVPFTYGQARYTTLDRINAAKVTSELINGIVEEPLVLDEIGTNTMINPNNATIALSWQSNDDFDIAVAYEDKKGNQGLVFFADKGNMEAFPYMMLDKDARGSRVFKQRETILINHLSEMAKVYIICWDYEAIQKNKAANFTKKSKVEVTIEDENGFASTATLQSDANFNATCLAKIEQQDGFVFTNISKGFNCNLEAAATIKSIEE